MLNCTGHQLYCFDEKEEGYLFGRSRLLISPREPETEGQRDQIAKLTSMGFGSRVTDVNLLECFAPISYW
jgi:hypothetical protein